MSTVIAPFPPAPKEVPGALAFVCKKLRIRLAASVDVCLQEGMELKNVHPSPFSRHAISLKHRTFYFEEKEAETADWLHEVAHIYLTPPWGTVEHTSEFAMVFAWEKAAMEELKRRNQMTSRQLKEGLASLDAYTCPNGKTWESAPEAVKSEALRLMRAVCVEGSVLTYYGEPTWVPDPTWSQVDAGSWDAPHTFLSQPWPETP